MTEPAQRQGMRPVLVRMLEGRVGSTLVMQLLATSDAVALDRVYPFEHSYLTYLTRLVGQIDAARSQGADLTALLYGGGAGVGPLPFDAGIVDPAELARRALGAVWTAFADAVQLRSELNAAAPPALYAEKFWGDVGPLVAAGLRPIVVDLVRDPRDVVASIRAFNVKTGRAGFGRAAVEDDDQHLRRLVVGMALRLGEFAAAPVAADAHIRVRYEDLVTDLEAEAARLGALLGTGFDAGAVLAAAPSLAGHMTSSTVPGSIGRWTRDLPVQDVALIERRLGRQMTELGYSLSAGERGQGAQ